MTEALNPAEHAAVILELLDGNLPLLREMLPSFLPIWTDYYGQTYCSELIAALTAPEGEC